MSSPWGEIDHVYKYAPGVSFVSTPGHGGMRVTLKALKEYACDFEYLYKKAIKLGNYLYFEEDCDFPLFLFDCPRILKAYAAKHGANEDEVFNTMKSSVKHWHPDYFDDVSTKV